jgi:Flp pilus assembly protein CpaB
MRAIAMDVNETSSVAGLIVPGCHVDIVSTLGADNDHMVARTVAQDIPVVAVGQRLSAQRPEGDKSDGSYRTVTLLATPHNAELIELAANTSRCRLVLRGEGDKARTDSHGVRLVELEGNAPDENQSPVVSALLTGPATQPVIPAEFNMERPHHSTEVIRGGSISNVDFQLPTPTSNTMTDTPTVPAVQYPGSPNN